MHGSVMLWVAQMVEKHDLTDRTVLEVGSYDVNGSVRSLFESDDYIGLDMNSGPGVNIVGSAHAVPFEADEFEVVVCTEMLEHDSRFWETLLEVKRVLKPGGFFVVTTRSNGFPQHDYPGDYYRFERSAAPHLMALAGCDVVESLDDPEAPGIFVLGFHW